MARFIHEYVHFLQNLYTPWGLFTSFKSYTFIKSKIDFIQENLYDDVILPVQIERTPHAIWYNGIYTVGEGKRMSEFGKSIDTIAFNDKIPITWHRKRKTINNEIHICVTIEVETLLYGKQEILFGAWMIKESMAQIIQNTVFNKPSQEPRDFILPYDFVTVLCKQYAPSVFDDIEKQIAICWASLFSMKPGEDFFNILEFVKSNSHLTAEEIICHYISHSKIRIKNSESPVSFKDFMSDIQNKFLTHLEAFVNQQCNYFRTLLSEKSICEVFSYVIKLSRKLSIEELNKTLQYLGMPVVFGYGNSSCFPFIENDPGSETPILKLFAAELLNTFLSGNISYCPLRSLCKNDPSIEMQYSCVSNPLMIDVECPMFFASHLYGIHDRSIDIKG